MADIDWYDIKFLESASNLRDVIKKSVGRRPSATIAGDIAACLLQGRLFFEIAASSPLQIRPLQIYYGVVGFAKAVVLSRRLKAIDTLAQSHGLSDISSHSSKIESLLMKVNRAGTFQEFNDTVAPLGGFSYYDDQMTKLASKPFDTAERLADKIVPIQEIFARVPGLERLYEKTFGEPAKTLSMGLSVWPRYNGYVELRLDDPELFADRASLATLVQKWRRRHPFLEKWRLSYASVGWDHSILGFCNVLKEAGEDDLAEAQFRECQPRLFEARTNLMHDLAIARIPFLDILPPLCDRSTRGPTYVIEPYDGIQLCEEAVLFMVTYMLSSLVRYRPQIWQHAISRSVSVDAPADDRCLALVERLLDAALESFPRMTVEYIVRR